MDRINDYLDALADQLGVYLLCPTTRIVTYAATPQEALAARTEPCAACSAQPIAVEHYVVHKHDAEILSVNPNAYIPNRYDRLDNRLY